MSKKSVAILEDVYKKDESENIRKLLDYRLIMKRADLSSLWNYNFHFPLFYTKINVQLIWFLIKYINIFDVWLYYMENDEQYHKYICILKCYVGRCTYNILWRNSERTRTNVQNQKVRSIRKFLFNMEKSTWIPTIKDEKNRNIECK